MMHRLPLRYWLPLVLLAAFTVLLGTLSWLHLADFRARTVEDVQSGLSRQALMLQHHIEEEIRQRGLEQIQDELALLATDPDITTYALVDEAGTVLLSNRLEWRNIAGSRLQDFKHDVFIQAQQNNRMRWHALQGNNVLTLYLPISLPSAAQLRPATGALFVRYDNSVRMQHVNQQVLERFLLALAGIASVLGLLIWRLNNRLLAPLHRLSRALNEFGAGEHHTRLPIAKTPELGALANAFNQMADAQEQLVNEVTRGRQNLADMLDSIGDAVIATDAEGRIVRMNKVAETLTGWPLADAQGQPVETVLVLVDNQHRQTAPMPVRKVLETGESVQLANHTVLIRRDKKERHLADSCSPVRDAEGHITGVIMVCRDISEEYRLREALHERETIYRLMTEQTLSFDYWLDDKGGYRYISPSCEAISGYTATQFQETPNLLEQITHPDDQARIHQHGEDVSRPGLPPYSMEFRIITQQGQVRWMQHACQDIFGEDGTWLGRRASNIDITARKEAEMAMGQHTTHLENLVSERTHQLQQTNLALAAASQAKDEFLAAMSHELRTPLTAILGLSEILRDQVAGPLNPKQRRYIKQVEESGRHLLELINDILDVAKIEAGKFSLDISDVNVTQTVEASLGMVREAARAKNLRVSLAEDGRVTHLAGDPRRIKQALVNLLSNAVKFTPEGGQIGLDVFGDDELQQVNFVVWDNGIGIPQNVRAQLFQPFVQLDSQLSRQYAGTGLGLVLVKHMAELHGGSIRLESTAGQGSRFTMTLPWNPEEKTLQPNPALTPQIPAGQENPPAISRRVLLVDDNAVNLEMAREFLEACGHQVFTADNGEEALAQMENDPLPDLVLLDIQMPVMDGPTTLTHLRANPRTAKLHVVALTALAMTGDRDRLLNMGFDDYLAKPFQFNVLENVVNKAGSGSRSPV